MIKINNNKKEEVTFDEKGNKIVKNISKKVDTLGNAYTEEEIIGTDGKKRVVKKMFDKEGNEIE